MFGEHGGGGGSCAGKAEGSVGQGRGWHRQMGGVSGVGRG